MLSIRGRNFQIVRGSDVNRNGMYLELSENSDLGIAEVFFSDESRQFVVNTFGNDIPLEAMEWMIGRAKQELP